MEKNKNKINKEEYSNFQKFIECEFDDSEDFAEFEQNFIDLDLDNFEY